MLLTHIHNLRPNPDPVIVWTQANHGGKSVAEFMTNAVQGPFAV